MRATAILDIRVAVNANTGKRTVINERKVVSPKMRFQAIRDARAAAEGKKT